MSEYKGDAHSVLRKYGRFSDRAPARQSGLPDSLFCPAMIFAGSGVFESCVLICRRNNDKIVKQYEKAGIDCRFPERNGKKG